MTPSASQPYEEQPDLPTQSAATSGTATADTDLTKQAFTPGTILALGGLVLVALALRAFCAVYYIVTIDTEGGEYVTLAANLLAGRGYYGKTVPGVYLIFPPLFPFLIGVVSFLVHDLVAAARVVSVAMGSALVLPVFLIARQLYGGKVALIAAALVAVHPFLVEFSATAYSETTYVTLLFAAAYFMFRGMRSGRARDMAFAGLFFGLAYLTRLEAVACAFAAFLLVLACAAAMFFGRGELRRDAIGTAGRGVLLLAAFLAVAAPYVGFLYQQTGRIRFEAKSPLNLAIDRQVIINGAEMMDASHGIDADLNDVGVWSRTNIDVIRSTKSDVRELAQIVMFKARRVMPQQAEVLTAGSYLGNPFLFVLALIGLFRRPWQGQHAIDQIYLFGIAGVGIAAMFGIYYVGARFFVVFVPLLAIWGANGAVELSRWVGETFRTTIFPAAARMGPAVAGLMCLAALALSLADARNVYEIRAFNRDNLPILAAAEWVRRQGPANMTVTDGNSVIAFHADARYLPFPYADSALAMRYLRQRKADYVILREMMMRDRPYFADWWENGLPDPGAELVYRTRAPYWGEVRVYRLKHGNGG